MENSGHGDFYLRFSDGRFLPKAASSELMRTRPRRKSRLANCFRMPQKPGGLGSHAFVSARASGTDRAKPSTSSGSTDPRIFVRIKIFRIPRMDSGVFDAS